MFVDIIRTMRPKQWYKNILLFVGIVFSMNFQETGLWLKVSLAFLIFCMLSGGQYLINDVIDYDKDRVHPRKKERPIASGRLNRTAAIMIAVLLIAVSLTGAYFINLKFLLIAAFYLILTLSYSLLLKEFLFIDILVIAIGFVLRAIAGCWAINVKISEWLILCTLLLAIFLALAKRRNEITILGEGGRKHRTSLKHYSLGLLDQLLSITVGSLILSYSLYTFMIGNEYMMITIPLAVYGLFRYLYLVREKDFGGEPELLFKDVGLIISLAIWGMLVILVLLDVPQRVMNTLGGV